jgi:predicted dehydrogenase
MNARKSFIRREPVTSRRTFLGSAAAAGAGLTIVHRHVLAQGQNTQPSEKITLAAIGVGDQGKRDLKTFLDKPQVRVVAVCDVDANNRKAARDTVNARYGDQACAAYKDFRELLATQKDLDAVLVVVPDHSHAIISAAALKAGKQVYCQKPFTHTVYEARKLAELTRKSQLATQLGTVTQAGEGPRLMREWVQDGAIGGVREVHIWSNRPFWPQGIDRPIEKPPVPQNLDWDLWLGPAPYRSYHPAYLPLVFRGWWDFGTGALGDMGCYALDIVFRVLDLKYPTSVEGCGSGFAPKMWARPTMNTETYPRASLIRWEFPARGSMPPVAIIWYDGGLHPPHPKDLEQDRPLGDQGMIFVGEKGTLMSGFAGGDPRLVPETRMKVYKQPPKTLTRSIGHHEEWIQACRGGESAGANFEFSSIVTEALLLGNVALRAPGQKLCWDAPNLKFMNVPEANKHLHCEYRKGWSL